MATITWLGGSSTDGAVAANWGGVLPGASDTIVFDGNATQNCTFSSSAISQVVQIQIKEDFEHQIVFATSSHAISLQSMIIEKTGAIAASTATTFAFSHSSFPFTSGGLATYVSFVTGAPELGEPEFTNGVFSDSTSRNNVTYTFSNPASSIMVLDDGVYPHVTITAQSGTAYFKMGYGTPGTTYGKVDMLNFNVSAAVEIREGTGTYYPTANDTLKKFKFGGTLTISSNYFYAYKSQVEFIGSASGLTFPAEGQTTGYGDGSAFNTQFHDIILSVNTAGHTIYLNEGRTLSCNYLEVGPGAKFIGPAQHPGAEIRCIKRPGIFGTWNFSQVADGIYSSNDSRPFMGVPQGGTGLISHTRTLLLFGNDQNPLASDSQLFFESDCLAVDRGIRIFEGADHPISPATGSGILWTKNTTPSTLIYTDDAGTDTTLGSGGGGGITALTGDVTASGSGSVAATIAAGAVEHAMLDNDCVDGDNIADDSINSEHYVDGSIDTAHIADDQVTYAKIQNVSQTNVFLGRDSGGAGIIEEIDATAARAILNVADGSTAYTNALAAQASLTTPVFSGSLSNSVTGFTSGSYTIAPIDNIIVDDNGGGSGAWDATSDYWTVPITGFYLIEFSAAIRYISGSQLAISAIYVDEGSGFGFRINGSSVVGNSGGVSTGSGILSLESGWKVALYCYHNGGSGKNLIGDNVSNMKTHLGIRMVHI
ncbi:MAG: hypothetical protein CMC15_14095 [Flavobacteriaceae bacterium]|nr:hypothetical protein [Flavobacteriaceae bacterium]